MSFLARYLAGETEQVWQELIALRGAVRTPRYYDDARAVAEETMRRVRRNLEALIPMLAQHGYRYNAPTLDPPGAVLCSPTPADLEALDEFERTHGPLPISVRAYFEIVGAVDLSQDYEQLIQWPDREGGVAFTELEMLGEYGPLVVEPFSSLLKYLHGKKAAFKIPLIPDEAGKAFYSGDYYYMTLPCADADAPISDAGSEYFVEHLRNTLRHAGFHGYPDHEAENVEGLRYAALPFLTEIARQMLPI